MSLARVFTRAQLGVEAPSVIVEVHLSGGLPSLTLVGMAETSVKESKDRVRSALLTSGFDFPAKRITINMAPADLSKEGGRFDLAIALGILAASGQLSSDSLANHEFLGELALNGELQPVAGALPSALWCGRGDRDLIVPVTNGAEVALTSQCQSRTARHLVDVVDFLKGTSVLPLVTMEEASQTFFGSGSDQGSGHQPIEKGSEAGLRVVPPDLSDVRGQPQAKRALEIAAAGQHNLLFIGPPGTGKTMLASRLPGILPPMSEEEALESASVYSIVEPAGGWMARWRSRPFRAPHHTASGVALVGGGARPRPGEISMAHGGVLFLDELPEYSRKVLDVLREPLESGRIIISRAQRSLTFPARFQLVAAMNPCPCGYLGDPSSRCRCTSEQVQRYQSQTSGPLLDRIDLHVEVPAIATELLQQAATGDTSQQVQQRVLAARERQLTRQGCSNAELEGEVRDRVCALAEQDHEWFRQAVQRLQLSARGYHRVLKLARTIADLEGDDRIGRTHLMEAVGYRSLDRGLNQS